MQSWADLWKPEFKDKVQILDDPREPFNIALLKMRQDPNTQDPEVLKAAYQELLKLRPNVLSFNSDNPASSFISGETEVGLLWNGSVRIAKNEGAKIGMIYPKEGTTLWIDNLAIPATAKNPEGAYKLINYMLSAPVAAKLTEAIGYPTSNKEALKLLPKELTEDPAVFLTHLMSLNVAYGKSMWVMPLRSTRNIIKNSKPQNSLYKRSVTGNILQLESPKVPLGFSLFYKTFLSVAVLYSH